MQQRTRGAVMLALGLLPLIVIAASSAREEFAAVLRRTPDPQAGERLFETCAACHGSSGAGVSDGTVPAIAGQHFRVIAKQLVDFRHDKRWDIRMEHFVDRHRLPDPQQLADLAAFVSQLPRASHPGGSDPDLLQRGAHVYFARCERCHGPIGEGDDTALVPRLAGQHADYLLRQFYDAVDGRRPNMRGEHAKLLEELERAELLGVADYLSRLMPPPEQAHMNGDL